MTDYRLEIQISTRLPSPRWFVVNTNGAHFRVLGSVMGYTSQEAAETAREAIAKVLAERPAE